MVKGVGLVKHLSWCLRGSLSVCVSHSPQRTTSSPQLPVYCCTLCAPVMATPGAISEAPATNTSTWPAVVSSFIIIM